jgi:hypothetical protein
VVRIEAIGPESDGEIVEVRFRLHAGEAGWIPPLREVWLGELAGPCAMQRHGRWQMFLATRGNAVVGRVAAIVNDDLRDAAGAPIGQLGWFECVDDAAAAHGLFEAGAAWLRGQGARVVWGPMNGGAHRNHRLMVRGFERTPFLFEPRNPAHHVALFEGWGFRVAHRWFSYELDAAATRGLGDRFGRVLAARPGAGTIDVIDPRDIPAGLVRLHALLDGFWKDHVGYASIAGDEFAEVFAGALAIMTERNLGFWRQGGRDLGCAFMYPDWADAARALDGHAAGWAAWARQPLPSRLIMHTLALLPEARITPAGMALMHHGLRLFVEDGYHELLVALVVEGLLGRQLGEPTREYVLYSRPL